jgi:hypothetical protein
MKSATMIFKEEIVNIRFPREEVLANPSDIRQRDKAFERALALGNLEHSKVRIGFMDVDRRIYEVETTVWAVTEETLCLKGSLQIPKQAVLYID